MQSPSDTFSFELCVCVRVCVRACVRVCCAHARPGNVLTKWERRWFVVAPADNVLRYYKKRADAEMGKPARAEFPCEGAYVGMDGEEGASSKYFRFFLETKERVLSLRAETEAERSEWVVALLAAGAQNHPYASHLAAHRPSAMSGAAHGTASPVAVARASSTSTFVPVPEGLKPGQRFQVEVPSGERFTVTVPAGAGKSIEVVVPARCMQQGATPSSGGGGGSSGGGGGSSRSGAGAESARQRGARSGSAAATPDAPRGEPRGERSTAWTLCSRFDVMVQRPAGLALGLALAPSRAGHLTVTDVTPGGLAACSNAFQLGDMLVSLNGEPLSSDLDRFISELDALEHEGEEVSELLLGVQRVEDEEALSLLLEHVSAEQHRLEAEKRSLSKGIRASQEDAILELAMQRSLSLARKVATADSTEDSMLSDAISQSLEDHAREEAVAEAEHRAVETAKRSSVAAASASTSAAASASTSASAAAAAEPYDPVLAAALQESREMSLPNLSDAALRRLERGGSTNAVRALEVGFSATEGLPPVETAAAARSRCMSTGAGVFSGGASGTRTPRAVSASGSDSAAGSGFFRSDSIKRVYEAQHRFVLAQLTAPGVEAFLDSDSEGEE